MSDAKREQSAYQRARAGDPAARWHAPAGEFPPTAKVQALNLELLELAAPWGSAPKEGRDPYNSVGRRAQKQGVVAASRR